MSTSISSNGNAKDANRRGSSAGMPQTESQTPKAFRNIRELSEEPFALASRGSSVSPQENVKGISRKSAVENVFSKMSDYDVMQFARGNLEEIDIQSAVKILKTRHATERLIFLMRHCNEPVASFARDALFDLHSKSSNPDFLGIGVLAFFMKGAQKEALLDILNKGAQSADDITAKLAKEGLATSKNGGIVQRKN